MNTTTTEKIIERELRQANQKLSLILKSDIFLLCAPMTPDLDFYVRDKIEEIKKGENGTEKLTVLLETEGGAIEVVERIVRILRRHYPCVEFIIPNYAYSAGTVLALSGDEIHMDYYSVLGPIDPQLDFETGRTLPGLGYLNNYRELLTKVNEAAQSEYGVQSVQAELSLLINKFDPATIFLIEQSIQHSKKLLEDWLPKYKFRNWDVTETKGEKVTEEKKKSRAESIANTLGNAEEWHSHGRGIHMKELRSNLIGLKIKDFGKNEKLSEAIRFYYALFKDYIVKIDAKTALHSRYGITEIPI